MKKLIIPMIFGLLFCMQPGDLFAKTFCFAGGAGASGSYFFISGGKVEEKPFSGNWIIPGSCNVPVWATIVKDSTGRHFITINVAHDPVGPCVSFWMTADGTSTVSMSGEYDNNQDGTYEGPATLTEIGCSSIPTAIAETTPKAGSMGVAETSEK